MNKLHYQLPDKMGIEGLNPKDQLVYVCIRSYMNKDTMESFPSLDTISKKIKASVPTIRTSIKRLVEKDYISVRKDGKKNIYKFNNLVHYEPFSDEFLNNDKISFEAKAFLAAAQLYMYTDVKGYGKLSMSNYELANKINSSESSVRRYNQELERKNYMTILKNEARDIETGCSTDTKIYNLNDLGQAIVWAINNHEERIQENTNEIQSLKLQVEEQQRLIKSLIDERRRETLVYTL